MSSTTTTAPTIGAVCTVLQGTHEGESCTVLDLLKSGWVLVELGSGEAVKVRASHLQLDEAGDEAEQDPDDAPAEDDSEEDERSNLAVQMAKHRAKYQPATNASGTRTLTCGDAVALLLLPLEPLQVCAVADLLLAEPAGYHAARYASLNPGQQRMNAGNRIRAALRGGKLAATPEESVEAVRAAVAPFAPAPAAAEEVAA